MKKKTIIVIVSVVLVCALGLIASFVFDWPISLDGTGGNIGKANRFSRKTATEQRIENMEELLRADEDYKNSIVLAYTVMHTRAMQFGALVDMSNQVAGDIPEFEAVLKEMNELAPVVNNVAESLSAAGADLNKVLAGESCPEVTQSTINASLAYKTLQKQNALANRFIETTDKYIKKAEASDELLFVRDQWVDYQMMTAALEGDTKAAKKLQKKGTLLPSEKVESVINSFDGIYQIAILSSASLSNTLEVNNSLVNAVSSEVVQESTQQTMNIINSGILVETVSGGPKILPNSGMLDEVLSANKGPKIESNTPRVEDFLSNRLFINPFANSDKLVETLAGGPKILPFATPSGLENLAMNIGLIPELSQVVHFNQLGDGFQQLNDVIYQTAVGSQASMEVLGN